MVDMAEAEPVGKGYTQLEVGGTEEFVRCSKNADT